MAAPDRFHVRTFRYPMSSDPQLSEDLPEDAPRETVTVALTRVQTHFIDKVATLLNIPVETVVTLMLDTTFESALRDGFNRHMNRGHGLVATDTTWARHVADALTYRSGQVQVTPRLDRDKW